MQLADFPRPRNDNGRGVHWSTSLYHPSGVELQKWVARLQAMSVKWVKLLDDGGTSSMDVCQRLLDADIMPIVRLWRDRPNPGHLDGRQVEGVRQLIAAGVRYFETNNEPDLPAEWRGSRPENWLDIVIDNFIWDADVVLEMGGLPALPAMGDGGGRNPFSVVVEKGRADLFDQGAWAAIHNYTLNHPLDYPDDDVNQIGRPLTPKEYEELARWAHSGVDYEDLVAAGVQITRSDYERFSNWAWDGRSMAAVNERRARDANPGQTVFEDPSCFRRWEVVGQMALEALGFHVPVISTEGGPVVGWGDDQRYAKVNPWTQAEWQLEIARFMEKQSPAWYFACCTWLLAAYRMGDMSPAWEQMAWYTNAWDLQFGLSGELPIVQLLKDEGLGMGSIDGVIRTAGGRGAAGLPLKLLLGSLEVATCLTGPQGEFHFEGLVAGRYSLGIVGQGVFQHRVDVDQGTDRSLHLWLGRGASGALDVTVIDAAGALCRGETITLESVEGQVGSEMTDSAGVARFADLCEGIYRLRAEGAVLGGIVSDGWGGRSVELVVPVRVGMRYTLARKRMLSKDESGNRHMFFGKVVDGAGEPLNGVEVQMSWANAQPGIRFPTTTTGKDPYKPAGYFEFIHTPGEFQLQVVQGDWESDVADGLLTADVPGREGDRVSYEIDFCLSPLGAASSGCAVAGNVGRRAAGRSITLRSGDAHWLTEADAVGRFAFRDLPPGTYDLELPDLGAIETGILLANGESFELDFPMDGVLVGQAAGKRLPLAAHLRSDRWSVEYTAELSSGGGFRFDGLSPGPYRLTVAEQSRSDLWVTGTDTQTLYVIGLEDPSESRICGRVVSSEQIPIQGVVVKLMKDGVHHSVTRTGADGTYSFEDLFEGSYSVSLVDAGVPSEVSVDGMDAVTLADIQVPAGSVGRVIDHYVLLGTSKESRSLTEVLLVLDSLERCGATAGFSVDIASTRARRVTIVGDSTAVTVEDEARLRSAGCEVQRLEGDSFALELKLEGLC